MSQRLPNHSQRIAASNAAFEAAVSLHRQGHLLDAERMYEAQLKLVRDHFGALHNLGLLCAQQGRLQAADTLIRKALKRNPKSAEAHNSLGNILHRAMRYAEANIAFGRALALRPDYASAYNNRGTTLQALNRIEEAISCYQRAVAIVPGYADAEHNLGNALRALGQNEEAIAHFNRALTEPPGSATTHRDLADTLQNLRRYSEAIDHYLAALAIAPGDSELYYNLATALLLLNRYEESAANYRRALALKSDYAQAHNNLGSVLLALGRPEEALISLDEALVLAPGNVDAHSNRGQVLLALTRQAEAVAAFEQALEIRPDHAASHNNLGIALRELGRYEEAITHFEAALELRSGYGHAHSNLDSTLREAGREAEAAARFRSADASLVDVAEAHFNMGVLSAELGRVDAARQALEMAVDLKPKHALYYHALSDIKRFAAGDRHLAGIEALAQDIAMLSVKEQMHLHFALGKVLADIGQHGRSFHHQLQANALKRQEFSYDEIETLAKIDRIGDAFTPEVIQSLRGVGDSSPLPVFIVGMPRSGTSLIEQILASHPRVFGAGELDHFGRLVIGAGPNGVTRESVRALGPRYLAAITALAPPADRITDKMPANFLFVGLIHLALPNARIIHARRDPVDTCLSNFSKLFAGEQPFAYDLGELGRYYRAYARLMAHWRSVLPEGVMLEVSYEEVVADLEGQARRIIGYCGLEWDDACLEFHKAERAVRTASVMQVRQPIYRSSVGRGRAYAHLLTPLLEALEIDPAGDAGRG
ncbi:MAG TPA: tetratricopeptide repeat protein [Acetobacteraceae bacterium]|nr:tetratricopeptide repeat protein [Acetobacteraceae bacterium]